MRPTGELHGAALFPISCPTCESRSEHPGVPGVRASFEQALRIVESGKLDVRPLVTHTLPLQEFERALDLLSNRPEPVVKIMLTP